MRLAAVIALGVLAASLPYVLGRPLARRGSPCQLIVLALTAMAAIAASSIVVLGTVVDSAGVPTRTLPNLVERCVGAAGQLLRHPVQHWPRIVAAMLLLGLAARAAWAVFITQRTARRQRAALLSLSSATQKSGHMVIASDRPFAFTVGVFLHRDVVISQGLIDRLSPEALRSVIAHERAHADGRHGALNVIGIAAARAFSFFPPMRLAGDQLVLGLELAADQRALEEIDDPTVLAAALLDVAEHTDRHPTGALAASGHGLAERVRRLTQAPDAHGSGTSTRPATGRVAVLISIATLVVLLGALPLSARNLTGSARAEAAHTVCHLPHDG
jgi:Zn-dependent protease with chaperone function